MIARYLRTPAVRLVRQPTKRLASTARASGPTVRRNFATAIGAIAAVGFGAAAVAQTFPQKSVIRLDEPADPIATVQPETKVDPFPVEITASTGQKYSLLGVGVRSVSFLGFHVYGLGIYINEDDKMLAKDLLSAAGSTAEERENALLDPVEGGKHIAKLLTSGVRFMIRIVPVRNTDFGHMRDGFVRTTMAHPRFKAEGNNDEVGHGINELKRAFGRKRSVPKGRIMYLDRGADGTLSVYYYDATKERGHIPELLGTVSHPLVSELLFLQYTSGTKPSSESARRNAVKGLAAL